MNLALQDEKINGKALQKRIRKDQMDRMQIGIKNSSNMMMFFKDPNGHLQ